MCEGWFRIRSSSLLPTTCIRLPAHHDLQQVLLMPSFTCPTCVPAAEAEELAQLFNSALSGSPASWQIRFLPCWVYQVGDQPWCMQVCLFWLCMHCLQLCLAVPL
jgi:hypothetical protein